MRQDPTLGGWQKFRAYLDAEMARKAAEVTPLVLLRGAWAKASPAERTQFMAENGLHAGGETK